MKLCLNLNLLAPLSTISISKQNASNNFIQAIRQRWQNDIQLTKLYDEERKMEKER